MIKLTIPQRVLVEAGGLSRRGFLKFLGSAAGAASGSSVPSLSGLTGFLKLLSPTNRNKYKAYLRAYKDSGLDKEQVYGVYYYKMRGMEPPPEIRKLFNKVTPDVIKGMIVSFVDDKNLGLSLNRLAATFGPDPDISDFYRGFINNIIKQIGPDKIVKIMLDNHSLNLEWSLSSLDSLASFNKPLKQYLLKLGFKGPLSKEDLSKVVDRLRENQIISADNAKKTKDHLDTVKSKRKKKSVERSRRWDWIPYIGKSKSGPFDPTSIRTAQPVGPFEERLKTNLMI